MDRRGPLLVAPGSTGWNRIFGCLATDTPIRLLHLADLHLDRPFVGLPLDEARARRRELREALERCLALAVERCVDAVTIGGDLWEDEHVTPDTLHWVAHRLGELRLPVVLVAGNHDPLRPGGPYRRVSWPENVHLLPPDTGLQPHDLGELCVWGMSWGAAPLGARALEDFAAPLDGRAHVLLLHGTAGPAAFQPGAHCPFTARAVRAAGFLLCLAGHIHAGGVRDEVVVYPGSPEPLAWDETGRHAVAIVELPPAGPPRVELVDVNRRRYSEVVVDCHGAASSADLEGALHGALARALGRAAAAPDGAQTGPRPESAQAGPRPEGAQVSPPPDGARTTLPPGAESSGATLCLRAALRGRIAPDCRVDLEHLRATGIREGAGELAMIDLRDETQPAFDLDALAAQPTALGAFVCELRERIESCDSHDPSEAWERARLELALDLGLRAMYGDELAHVP